MALELEEKEAFIRQCGQDYEELIDSLERNSNPPFLESILAYGEMVGNSIDAVMSEKVFDVVYNGWTEYRTKIKGWPKVHRIDIVDWENWKKYLFERMEHGTTNS